MLHQAIIENVLSTCAERYIFAVSRRVLDSQVADLLKAHMTDDSPQQRETKASAQSLELWQSRRVTMSFKEHP
jgi:hypothetical protein